MNIIKAKGLVIHVNKIREPLARMIVYSNHFETKRSYVIMCGTCTASLIFSVRTICGVLNSTICKVNIIFQNISKI
jgi:hypothetical protein